MSLLNPLLISGLLLAGLPILLHLMLRQKPKKLVFPALQLILARKQQNLKRMRLRHLWLLILRVLVIALIVFAVARPSLPAADYSFNTREWITLMLVVAVGIATYFTLLKRWQSQQLPRHELATRRSYARGWTTGGTLILLLLVLVWPYQRRIAAEIKAPPPSAQLDLPVAAIFLFDTSLSMSYQQEGKTRLDVARDIASAHISDLASGSRVSIVDNSNDNPIVFQPTLSAAQTRLQSLTTSAISLPMNDRLRTALLAQEEDRERTIRESGGTAGGGRERFLRRIYILTDLSKEAWRLGNSQLLKGELERLAEVGLFLVDVGEESPANISVRELRLSREQVSTQGTVHLAALVESVGGAPREVGLELNLIAEGQPAINKGRPTVNLQPGTPQWVSFPLLSDLNGPTVQGSVRVLGSDPLEFDNQRHFSIQISRRPAVLVVSPSLSDADEWLAMLDPEGRKFAVTYKKLTEFGAEDLEQYDVVHLINIPSLLDADWQRLGGYVEAGGGLALFLGSERVVPSNYQRGQAALFLPALPTVHRYRKNQRLNIDQPEHPVFRKLNEDRAIPILENDIWIDRFFKVDLAEGAGVLATFTDRERSPAVVERLTGKGRTVMMTTAVDAAQGMNSRWNNFASPTDVGWPVIGFAESLTLYLARATENRFNYEAGEDVLLTFPPASTARSFQLRRPEFRQSRESLLEGRSYLVVGDARDVGQYQLTELPPTPTVIGGFSVNARGRESDLTRLGEPELVELLGEQRFQVARSIGELTSNVVISHLGREVFPIVLALLVVVFLGEHLVANRFYEVDQSLPLPPARLSDTANEDQARVSREPPPPEATANDTSSLVSNAT
ncbi:MAG: BatA domain-containing protein [Planctomycetaceae bacterium]